MNGLHVLQDYKVKVVDDIFPPDNVSVALSEMKVEYTQSLDCCQPEKDHPDCCQILTITTDDDGGGKFIRIKTGEAGWSISNVEELVGILNDFIKRLQCES